MGTPPIRGMGPGWILRSWSGRSSIPQRIARFRQSGVRTNAAANAATVTMNSEYMADTSEEKVSRDCGISKTNRVLRQSGFGLVKHSPNYFQHLFEKNFLGMI